MPLIEKRYAEALIKISSEEKSTDKILDELNQVDQLVDSNAELKKFIDSPAESSEDKKVIIDKLFKNQLDQSVVNFLKLLVDKGRMRNFKGIVKEYSDLADEMRSLLNLEITTAVEVEKEQLDKIAQKYKVQYKSQGVNVKHVIDPSIIGGVIVKIGDKMIDSSIKGKLNGLLDTLNNA